MLKVGDNADALLAIHSTPLTSDVVGSTASDVAGMGMGNMEDLQHQHDTPQQPYFEHTHEGHDGVHPTPQRA
jgi:hypothetical protein